MYNKAVTIEPTLLAFVPDRLKTEEMWDEAVGNWSWPSCIPDHLRMQETCNEIMQTMPDVFHWISERFKKQSMC